MEPTYDRTDEPKEKSKYEKTLTEFEESNLENDNQLEEDRKNKEFNMDNNDYILIDIKEAMINYCEEMAVPLCNKNFTQYAFDNFIDFLIYNA